MYQLKQLTKPQLLEIFFKKGNSQYFSNYLLSQENRIKCIEKFKKPSTIVINPKLSEKFASVLIPLCEKNGEISLLYTLRSNRLSRHLRQVSFPGGLKDSTDLSDEDCALRETEEEIGISRSQIDVWGSGSVFHSGGGPVITPIVAFINDYDNIELKLNPNEVEQVFTVPIHVLGSEKSKRYTQFRPGNKSPGYSIPVYVTDFEEKIWGITAILTHLFLSSLLTKDVYSNNFKYVKDYKNV